MLKIQYEWRSGTPDRHITLEYEGSFLVKGGVQMAKMGFIVSFKPILAQKCRYPNGYLHFLMHRWTRKDGPNEVRVTKCPGDTWLVRGRVLQIPDASGTDVDGI